MSFDLSNHIVLGISSSALFDTRKEHNIYMDRGQAEYVAHQVANEKTPLNKGPAFPLVEAMLHLNEVQETRQIEVVVMSQNEPEAGLRIMNSIEHHGLQMTRACFTGGQSVAKYLEAYSVSLFLSRNEYDVRAALKSGCASGLLYDLPGALNVYSEQLRLAFDGDAIIFSDESEKIFKEHGIDAFYDNEKSNANNPMPKGPFAAFLKLISEIQLAADNGKIQPVRTALVTARNSPADKRVILTLRAYDIRINELFFMGGVSKDKILKAFRPHIFFDDQEIHAEPASRLVPSALVPTDYPSKKQLEISFKHKPKLLNKEEFKKSCRGIFLPYMPLGGKRLSHDFSDFIVRNSNKTSEERARLINDLNKYNISDLGLTDLTLNREGVADIKRKLSKLE